MKYKVFLMREPSVTILLTVKNSRETIKNCIDSLLSLNYKNYKIYVTDAFSTDETYEILKKYKRKIKLEQISGNMAKAYNYMTKKVYTKFIAYTDSDCIVEKNWLKELISSFTSENIIGVAGFCGTPKNVKLFQKVIGKELEYRFKNFPKFISRAPTMNFAIRTNIAKRVDYDERLDVSQEVDWGYRLNKYGKIFYNPKAKVYHYHRSDPKKYFNQQKKYGKFVVLTYLKNKDKILGDHISTTKMMLQIPLFWLFFIFLFFSFFIFYLSYISFICLFFIFLLYALDLFNLKPSLRELPFYLLMFVLRTFAWSIGILQGLIFLFK